MYAPKTRGLWEPPSRETADVATLKRVREWADKNSGGDARDVLYDERVNRHGPFYGLRVCDVAALSLARRLGIVT